MKYHFDAAEHLHTLDGKALMGTSTICKIISKPLTWWAAGMALGGLGWLNTKLSDDEMRLSAAIAAQGKIANMTAEEYAKFLQDCYRAHDKRKTDAAKTGTDMHAELEKYVKLCIEKNDSKPLLITNGPDAVNIFSAWAVDNIAKFIWSEAHCYSETMWVGGITDVGAELKDGKLAVLDFKSSKDAYFDQFIQAGGYSQQIAENGLFDSDGNRTHDPMEVQALIVFPFGGGKPTAVYAVEDYQRAFVGACTLHRLQGTFDDVKVA